MKIKPFLLLSLFLPGLTLLLLGIANQTQASSAETGSSFSSALPAFIESPGAICPLTEAQQTASIEKFSEMMPTFQHPRCLNCHGGVRPFEANTSHAGGKMDLALDKDGDVLYDKTFSPCQECHGGLPGWEVPTQDVWFVDRDAVTLCQQMKNELGEADRWLDHITRDRGKTQFIEAGFAGMRGLNQDGIDYYEALFDKLPVPEQPPTSHADLIALAQAWVDTTEGEFQGDAECGCVPLKYAIQVEETFMAQISGDGATINWDGGSTLQIPLTFKEDGTFTGQVTADRRMHITLSSQITCDETSVVPVTWYVEGRLDEENDTMTFSIRFLLSPETVACPYNVNLPVPIYDTEAADNPLKMVELPAYVDETKTVEIRSNMSPEPVAGKFVLTLVKLPQ